MIRLHTVTAALLATVLVAPSSMAQPEAPEPPPLDPWARPAPAPRPPAPPRPPRPPRTKVKVVIPDDVRPQVEAELRRAQAEIARALAEVERNPHVPAAVKAKLRAQLGRLRTAKLDDLAAMAAEMEAFGEEMGRWGEEFGEEMERMGEQLGRDIQRDVEAALRRSGIRMRGGDLDLDFDVDFFDDGDDRDVKDPWATAPRAPRGRGPAGRDPVIIDLRDQDFALDVDVDDLQLSAPQRAQLKRIAQQEQAAVEPVARRIDALSRELRAELEDDDSDAATLDRLVDELSRHEGEVRKARLRALVETRKLLTSAQRGKVRRGP
ncbi:MAG: periplasmic heavy metal sensor [Kofleriaceae bacterium]|nr:periplasmic heavy metal sensor [Kofleriaceae bacterium]MBE7454922.1 periplasmic heavy metal sensor [Kofleriaceae bacterium]MCL4227472.1 periplasmic heavy metal sensor [Myxococcales bacterium]